MLNTYSKKLFPISHFLAIHQGYEALPVVVGIFLRDLSLIGYLFIH